MTIPKPEPCPHHLGYIHPPCYTCRRHEILTILHEVLPTEKGRVPLPEHHDSLIDNNTPLELAILHEQSELLARLLTRLSTEKQLAVTNRFFYGFSLRQTAKELQTSHAQTRRLLEKAMEELRTFEVRTGTPRPNEPFHLDHNEH